MKTIVKEQWSDWVKTHGNNFKKPGAKCKDNECPDPDLKVTEHRMSNHKLVELNHRRKFNLNYKRIARLNS